MRIVCLDPNEHRIPSGEEYSSLALSPKKHFSDLDQFFFATVASDHFPKDERWYSKKEIQSGERKEQLRQLIRSSKEFEQTLPENLTPLLLLEDEWNEIDVLFETEGSFGRFLWITTA
jgi:hypothetical protein